MAADGRQEAPDWVARARAGDEDACRELYRCVRDEVLPRLRVPRHLDREEIVADTVSAVWEALRRLRDDQKVLAFATTVARRLAQRKLREKGRFVRLDAEGTRAGAGPRAGVGPECSDPSQGNLEREELLHTLSGALKSAERALFRLLYVSGESGEEVEEALGVDGPNLRKRKHRMHQRLRSAAERYRRG